MLWEKGSGNIAKAPGWPRSKEHMIGWLVTFQTLAEARHSPCPRPHSSVLIICFCGPSVLPLNPGGAVTGQGCSAPP